MTFAPAIAKQDGVPLLVSIIINNYNYARFVGAAIESALRQTYERVEVIVVDDGSTDESAKVIDSFGTKISSIYKSNGGQGSAYNAGYTICKGDLIHFLDADDLLLPDAMKTVVECWKPGVSKVQFRLLLLEGAGDIPTDVLVPVTDLASGDVRAGLLKTGNYSTPPSSGNTYSRLALNQIIPLPESQWRTAADLYCIFQCAFLGKIESIPTPLGLYRLHGANMDAQSTISGKLLRYRLSLENRRNELLSQCALKHGLSYDPGAVRRDFGNVKLRLASKLVDPIAHPYPADTVPRLLLDSLVAAFTNRGFSVGKRLLFCAWLVALVLTPKRWIVSLLGQGFNPTKRPQIFKKILRPHSPQFAS